MARRSWGNRTGMVLGGGASIAAAAWVVHAVFWAGPRDAPRLPAPEAAAPPSDGREAASAPPAGSDGPARADLADDVAAAPLRDRAGLANATAARPAPRFELVRAEADGSVLVAGRAEPGEAVRVDVDGATAATARADDRGGFVLFLDLPRDDGGRVLELVARDPDGAERRAAGAVVIAPSPGAARARPAASAPAAPARNGRAPRQGAPETAAAVDASPVRPARPNTVADLPGKTRGSGVASGKGAAAPPQLRAAVPAPARTGATGAATERSARAARPTGGAEPPLPRPEASAEAPRPGGAAPAVLFADREGVRMLQPAAPGAQPADRVTVDVISYAADGAVLLEGRSAPPPPPVDSVRVYLDGAPVDSAPIRADGTWRLPIAELRSGLYTLRVDQLDRSGRVVSRFETPFKREDPAGLARLETGAVDAPGQTALRARLITVQPGYTLWGIASDRYGSGFDYVHIFEANDDQIRDPDLIYPGQIFDLPALPDEN